MRKVIQQLEEENKKLKKVIKVLKDKLEIHIDYDNFFREEKPYIIVSYREDEVLTKEEYELLKEVFGDE